MPLISQDLYISTIRLDEQASAPFGVPSGYKNLYITTSGIFLVDSNDDVFPIIFSDGTNLVLGENVTINGNVDLTSLVELNGTDILDVFLARTNTDSYTPTTDFHPATKKYVDDLVAGSSGGGYGVGSKMEWEYGVSDLQTTIGGSWLACEGGTIGNASSNGTARANADTELLFTKIWNTHSTTGNVVIRDSGGSPTTYGANAAADFAANKAITLPNLIGRTIVGLDASSTVFTDGSASSIAETSGAFSVTLSTGQLPSHTHSVPATGAAADGSGSTFLQSGSGINTGSAGSGQSHANVQPSYTSRYYICYAVS